jgi:KDEL-tailed cysteine endopeptidase
MKLALISGLAAGAVAASSAEQVNLCQDNDELLVRSVSAATMNGHLKVDITADKLPADTLAKLYVKVLGIPVVEAEIESYDPSAGRETLELDLALPVEVPTYVPLDVEVRLTRTGESHVASCVVASVAPNRLIVGSSLTTSRFGISTAHLKYLFGKWMTHFQHEMPVVIDDIETRFEVFRQNLLRILFHNQGDNTYTMAMNQFGHMTPEEFSATMLGYKQPEDDKVASALRGEAPPSIHKYDGVTELPETVDWVSKGAVTPVKNQGACGSCWSFSATGALEGAYFLKYGKLVSFSEEQLVTCDHVDMGCNGGLMDNAFKFVQGAGGLCSEDDYPYVSGSGNLPACKKCDVVKDSAPKSYSDVAHDEESLMSAVAQQPVAIAIEADQFAFQFYSGGVLTGKCGARLDHGVLLVGYGTLNGTKYWKVKNSWGGTWGMKGYINLQREKRVDGGECGILESASYPVM